MDLVAARAMRTPTSSFETVLVERRPLGPRDVAVEIRYSGICHTDLHHAHNDAGRSIFPIVPGHEIGGVVTAVGAEVTGHRVGDRAGVGCLIDSCGTCARCRAGLQQYCEQGNTLTYNTIDRDGNVAYGGYSRSIVVDERFVFRMPENLPLERTAPLLCAGITLYSPLRHWKAGAGSKVGIVGFGGLGHIGTQIAAALGARTVVFNLGPGARDDAIAHGADEYVDVADPEAFAAGRESFDLIISTVPANVDMNAYLELLTLDGTFVNLGVPTEPIQLNARALLNNRRSLSGSLSGGAPEVQEMLDFCDQHGIGADVEIISADRLDEAFERVARGDVRYRFVIDAATITPDDAQGEPLTLARSSASV